MTRYVFTDDATGRVISTVQTTTAPIAPAGQTARVVLDDRDYHDLRWTGADWTARPAAPPLPDAATFTDRDLLVLIARRFRLVR